MADDSDSGSENTKSPIVRAKQWMCNVGSKFLAVPSPIYRKRADSVRIKKADTNRESNGYRSAPGNLSFGQDFPHLKILRDICQKSIGGNHCKRRSSAPSAYANLYGAVHDLGTLEEIRADVEENEANQSGSSANFFDEIDSLSTENSLFPVPWRSYVDALPHRSTGNLETNTGGITPPVLLTCSNSMNGNICSLASSKSSLDRQPVLGSIRKISLDNLISYHIEGGEKTEVEQSKELITDGASQEGDCSIKISLQYFESTRQLRVLLLTAEMLKTTNCKIFVKLSLIGNSSKQKVISHKVHCTLKTVALNEVLYFEHDGRANGKFLKIRLYKQSRFVPHVKKVGEAMVALEELDMSSDTSMWLFLRKRRFKETITTQFRLVSDSESSKDETKLTPLSDISLGESDMKLLLDSTSLRHQARHQAKDL